MKKLNVFLSSAMTGELDRERDALRILFKADPTLQEFFTLYVIEEHASPQQIEKAYVEEVRESDLLLLLLDKQLRVAVQTEFDEARNSNLKIFVYIRNRTEQRDDELAEFIGQTAYQFHCCSFHESTGLCDKVKNDFLSDLTRIYSQTIREAKENQDYAVVSSPREASRTSLRYFDYDIITRVSKSDAFRDMDSDQLITLAVLRSEETGNLKEALLIYEVVLLRDHNNWQAYHNRGLILSEMGYSEDALFSYKRALDLNPNSHATLYNIGRYYRDKYRYDEAISYYKQALEIKPDKTSALGHLVDIYFSKKEYQRALEYAERAYSFEKDEINLSNLCLALSLNGDKEKALCRSAELKDTKYYNKIRAYIFYSTGEYHESLSEMDAFFQMGDFDYVLAIKKVYCLVNIDNLKEATNWINEIERNYYIHPLDYNNIAWTLYEKGLNLDYSVELLRKAVDGDPTILEAWKNLQCVLAEKIEIDEGLDVSNQALKYYPDDPGIIMNRAKFLLLSGNFRECASYMIQELTRLFGGEMTNSEIERMVNQSFANVGISNIESFEKMFKAMLKKKRDK